MSQPPPLPHNRAPAGPRFYVTPRRRLHPGILLLAFLIVLGALFAVLHLRTRAHRAAGADSDDPDDPSRVDTIYLGDPHDAPVATRPRAGAPGHPGSVHPFVIVHLPRGGDGFGQIPDTAAGHLLFGWLAAFNGTDPSALAQTLPTPEPARMEAAQRRLRRQTGGFTLVSAREVEPGILVFRLHDQTREFNEALGTLEVEAGSSPARIGSFSLRSVPAPPPPPLPPPLPLRP